MAHVLIPVPSRDFDPTEVAVSWSVLTRLGHKVSFASPDGRPGVADEIMVTGRGLDPWSPMPLVGNLRLVGLALRANAVGRKAYAAMIEDDAFRRPLPWKEAREADFDGLLLGGGHRARGMREFVESPALQVLVAHFFAADKPVAAICHGVLLVARSKRSDGKSVLFGRKTTSLTWKMERAADRIARVCRFWDRDYYRTYTEGQGEPHGYMSVQQEVTRALASPADFLDVPGDHPLARRKDSGLSRDTFEDDSPAWVVVDGNYVSARWPGDAHSFARAFDKILSDRKNNTENR